jgi:hypothetical protein
MITVAGIGAAAVPAHADYGYYNASYEADLDGNGTTDLAWDWDWNGDIDAVYYDLDGDYYWDLGVGDFSNNWIRDAFDLNVDGYFEFSDNDENGVIDQFWGGNGVSIGTACSENVLACSSPNMGNVGWAH